jgi:hypothetical protein
VIKKTKKYFKKKLDEAWRLRAKKSTGCEICATLPPSHRIHYTQLHPHHIIGRKNLATRWDLRNMLVCCPYHHVFGLWNETVQDNLGGWFLNWESDNDWMHAHRPEDKEYLREKHKITSKLWTLDELETLLDELKN